MNKRLIFNDFAKKAQSDRDYYIFGKPSQIGLIEDILAFFGMDYEMELHSESMHKKNLIKLQSFIYNEASEEQIRLIDNFTKGLGEIPYNKVDSEASDKVFISMPMNSEKCTYVNDIREGIDKAVKQSDNEPYFLDKEVHNDNIYNVMLNQISSCKFLIADLTSQNTGVYYEAGYAKALGKTVIMTCQESDFKNVHFDVKQIQIVKWLDKEDLQEKLYNQIHKTFSK